MGLVKEISRVIGAGIIGAGLLTACQTMQNNFSNIKEEERYGRLFMGTVEGEPFLAWDRYKHGNPDIRCYYLGFKYGDEVVLLLTRSCEETGCNEKNPEYQKFFLKYHGNYILTLEKDDDRNGKKDKRYTYFAFDARNQKGISYVKAELISIEQDRDNDGKFEEDEFKFKKPFPNDYPTIPLDIEKCI